MVNTEAQASDEGTKIQFVHDKLKDSYHPTMRSHGSL
jgi:hypothetical protein